MKRDPKATTDTAELSMLVDLYGGLSPEVAPSAPTCFRIFAFGNNASDQGDFTFDDESAAAVMAEWRKQSRDLVVDYEHQSNVKPPIKALAAGWFVPEIRGDGLYAANVRWTEEARAEIERKQYRFFSPTFDYDRKSKRVVVIRNAGLTNNPSLYALPALIAASSRQRDQEEDIDMELEQAKARIKELETQVGTLTDQMKEVKGETAIAQLSQTVGLAPTAKPDEVRVALTSLVGLQGKVREITGKDNNAGALGSIESWKSDAAETAQLRKEKKDLATAACTSQIKGLLDKASEEGRVPPSKRQMYETKALSYGGGEYTADSVEWVKAMLEDLPVLNNGGAAGGGNTTTVDGKGRPTPTAGTGTAMLSDYGRLLAKQSGTDVDKMGAWVAAEVAAGRLL